MTEKLLTNLIIYRNLLKDEIILNYHNLCKIYLDKNKNDNFEFNEEYYSICSILINKGFDSIYDYISCKISEDENLFSLCSEKGQTINDRTKKAVYHDLSIIKKLYEMPLRGLAASASDLNNFINYKNNEKLTDIIRNNKVEEIYEFLHNDYNSRSCGLFRNNYAFSVNKQGSLIPVDNFNPITMDNIYGYEKQKNKIINNTERFISGKYALNALLVGDSGTGKSTAVKALIPMFKDKKLRLIQVEKEKLFLVPNIITQLKNRGMYFIIFIDDLSFESNENSYKYLKSAVEGGIYEQPGNILFYVTSNRKHLIKESMTDRENEVHLRDAINEQTSLADRFGLTILYDEPNQNEFLNIVLGLAKDYGIKYEDEEKFLAEAKTYALQNGGRTGRTALQFIKTL